MKRLFPFLFILSLSVFIQTLACKCPSFESEPAGSDVSKTKEYYCREGQKAITHIINDCRFKITEKFTNYTHTYSCYELAWKCSDCLIDCYDSDESCSAIKDCLSLDCDFKAVKDNDISECIDEDFYEWEENLWPEKPNIYLYPEETTDVLVEMVFKHGSYLTWSWPEYNGGWDVTVDQDGIIDGIYPYLYYEAGVPGMVQRKTGIILSREELFPWLESYMLGSGFVDREVGDFLLYWTQELEIRDWYAVYPQGDNIINTMIALRIKPAPDSMMRLWLLIEGAEKKPEKPHLEKPVPRKLERIGFTVAEWGVIRKF